MAGRPDGLLEASWSLPNARIEGGREAEGAVKAGRWVTADGRALEGNMPILAFMKKQFFGKRPLSDPIMGPLDPLGPLTPLGLPALPGPPPEPWGRPNRRKSTADLSMPEPFRNGPGTCYFLGTYYLEYV